MSNMIVDMHAHVFAQEALAGIDDRYKQYAPQLTVEGGKSFIVTGGRSSGPMEPMRELYDTAERLRLMDEIGVDVQIISVTPGNFCYEAPHESGLAIALAQNNAIACIVEEHPDRFVGCATVPLQDPRAAVAELNRAVKDLGFTSVEIGTNVAGRNLDSPELMPFYNEAERLGAPIVVHPSNNAGADRMVRYHLGNIVGNPMETTLAIGSVVFGGVLEKFKKLTFCWCHGGGFWPYQIGRFDHGYEVRTEPKVNIKALPSSYVKRMYYDTITHSEGALNYLVSSMGADNVLFGTDFPWDMGDYDTIPMIRDIKGIDTRDKARILGETSTKLFKIKN
ncbi:MAG: amidohydrolase family protein [Candidatus Bathyarchaeota archaeon]|nr:amidohydrolase family protein [Candidatus Bathyarchaeota archaeon]